MTQSNTDFSISISHITPLDSGTYDCMKFKKGTPSIEYKSGKGKHQTSTGFSPKNISLKWLKNGTELPALWTHFFPEGDSVSYNLTSTVQELLTPSDVHSKVICELFVIFLLGLKVLLLFNVSIFFVHRKQKTTASGANLYFKCSSAPPPQSQLPPTFRQGPGLG
uniref:Signal-regulatory protein beta-1-like n=1 Tax=Phascolarctos cinereus TaxID=38626 RepID=A0A6P5KNB3_PHACI|nr:signal-regulatory protein beta-1-like [Phascolarctos cinereus]